MQKKRKRKTITAKIRLMVLQRDHYTCQSCGRSPSVNHGVSLEVDHKKPFASGGLDDLSNYQTLCQDCNRGKGNNEILNRTVKNDLDAHLNYVNPAILEAINQGKTVRVVANQEDYVKIVEKNNYGNYYTIIPSKNVLFGFQNGRSLGIYTIRDNHGSKVNFTIGGVLRNE